jgi:HTH-type transcriptional regulator, glycine betaine synthesis regulator
MTESTEQARARAISLAGEAMGELVSFWGFKASLGRIWTLLYLSASSLTADVIADRTQLSSGAVSMALSELSRWGLVAKDPKPTERKRHYQAQTDMWRIVRRIFREREMRMVGRAIQQFADAITILDEVSARDPSDTATQLAQKRLKRLLDLTRIGYRSLETFAESGTFNLSPIRSTLRRQVAGP